MTCLFGDGMRLQQGNVNRFWNDRSWGSGSKDKAERVVKAAAAAVPGEPALGSHGRAHLSASATSTPCKHPNQLSNEIHNQLLSFYALHRLQSLYSVHDWRAVCSSGRILADWGRQRVAPITYTILAAMNEQSGWQTSSSDPPPRPPWLMLCLGQSNGLIIPIIIPHSIPYTNVLLTGQHHFVISKYHAELQTTAYVVNGLLIW